MSSSSSFDNGFCSEFCGHNRDSSGESSSCSSSCHAGTSACTFRIVASRRHHYSGSSDSSDSSSAHWEGMCAPPLKPEEVLALLRRPKIGAADMEEFKKSLRGAALSALLEAEPPTANVLWARARILECGDSADRAHTLTQAAELYRQAAEQGSEAAVRDLHELLKDPRQHWGGTGATPPELVAAAYHKLSNTWRWSDHQQEALAQLEAVAAAGYDAALLHLAAWGTAACAARATDHLITYLQKDRVPPRWLLDYRAREGGTRESKAALSEACWQRYRRTGERKLLKYCSPSFLGEKFDELNRLHARLVELETELSYMPGGAGYLAAKADFEKRVGGAMLCAN